MGFSIISKYSSKCLCVPVVACVSASWGGAAVVSGDGVRGQCPSAVESRQWRAGLSSSLGTVYRSGQSRHQTTSCISASQYLFFICNFCFFVHKGRNVETVEVSGDSDFHTLSRLQPDTEYIVTIIPLYEGSTEGPVATARFKIGRCGFSSSSQHQIISRALGNLLCFYCTNSELTVTKKDQNNYLPQYTEFCFCVTSCFLNLILVEKNGFWMGGFLLLCPAKYRDRKQRERRWLTIFPNLHMLLFTSV